jgi:UDP-N-acetylglucosamine--N-acetylmuramyl-(pentapeptide) pyrophosphoryl-undecaprenol N-acetylglucosamine transferase
MKDKTVVIATGGTGGHIFPAQALADELKGQECKVVMAVDERYKFFGPVDNKISFIIPSASMSGSGFEKLKSLFTNFFGIISALSLLKKIKPDVVVGFGGYPSFPTVFAATILNIKTIIHEQNAIIGKTNAVLLSYVDVLATSFRKTVGIKEVYEEKNRFTGNPVRKAVSLVGDLPYPEFTDRSRMTLLVFGGSQGATIFSSVVPEAIAQLPKSIRSRLFVFQQCREVDVEKVEKVYSRAGVAHTLSNFFGGIHEQYAKCNLVIARAGASSLAEISATGRPAILVPIAKSAHDHQLHNARILMMQQGGWVIEEHEFTVSSLAKLLNDIYDKPSLLNNAAENIKVGAHKAASNLLELVKETMTRDTESKKLKDIEV